MKRYEIPLVPGPVSIPAATLAAYATDWASADLEPEFVELYGETAGMLGRIMDTRNGVVIALGEAMVVLWGAIKSAAGPGDRVLCVSSGLFGRGFADMARVAGAEARLVDFPPDEVPDPDQVAAAAREWAPTLVTMVHCETPSGTLTPVEAVGARLREVAPDALFVVDAVSSIGGAPLRSDAAGIDFCLLGTQKCLATVPDLGIVAVSERGWERVGRVGYVGYDALAPFRRAAEEGYFPYTHSWHAVAALNAACRLLLDEGLEAAYVRHARVARAWRDATRELGLELYPRREEDCSPTVTALKVPDGVAWPDLDRRLRERGMAVGGNYGELAGKVFRIGHMGTQATDDLLARGTAVLGEALRA
ncbi:MAG: aminotransferase class V-fold PLP-dependent enzyme [Chloroflexota bacterium]|nr:aminotransferase class V-fold PLP-dependent enzyme [Chloroflexota bacterium]